MKRQESDPTSERRTFLRMAAATGGLALVGCATTGAARAGHAVPTGQGDGEAEVTPGEDLMQEHELFGEHGFEHNVAEIARLENTLGIGDLAGFTAP